MAGVKTFFSRSRCWRPHPRSKLEACARSTSLSQELTKKLLVDVTGLEASRVSERMDSCNDER